MYCGKCGAHLMNCSCHVTVHICPVCNGSGEYAKPYPDGQTFTVAPQTFSCHGCGGQGWVKA